MGPPFVPSMHELNAGSRLGLSPRRADPHAHEKRPARLHTIGSRLAARGAGHSLATGVVGIDYFDHHTTWNFLKYLIWDTPTEENVETLKSVSSDWRSCLGHFEIEPLVDGILNLVKQLEADPTVETVNRLMVLDLPGSGPVSALMEERTWYGGDGHPYRVVMGVLIGDLPHIPELGKRFFFAPPQEANIRVIPTNAFPHFSGAIYVDLSNCDMLTHIRADAFGFTPAFGPSQMRIWDLLLPENPLKLVSIGSRAFKHIPSMSRCKEVDLGRFTALEEIGQEAFGPIGKLNLSGCTALREIGARAFEDSQLKTLDLRGCVSLKTIGNRAFFNSFLTTLDLSRNIALETIGGYAFYSAKLESLNLFNCTALEQINEFAFTCSPLTTLYLNKKLRCIEKSAFENAKLTDLALSHCADLIKIGDASFRDSRLSKIQMPPSLMFVGTFAFYDSRVEYLNLSLCTNLQTIGVAAFYKSPLRKLQLPVSIRLIGESAFHHAKLTQLDLKDCKHLEAIDASAFYDSPLKTLDFRGVSRYVKIGTGAFRSAPLNDLHGNNLAADLYGDPMITEDGGGGDDTNNLLPGDGGIPFNSDPMITEDGGRGDVTHNPSSDDDSDDDSAPVYYSIGEPRDYRPGMKREDSRRYSSTKTRTN